jgi:hypothetical protein
MNKEEACMTTGIQVRPDTKTEKFSQDVIHWWVVLHFGCTSQQNQFVTLSSFKSNNTSKLNGTL